MKLASLTNDGLTDVLAGMKRAFAAVLESSGRTEALQWIEDDISDICREMTRRGLESDTVTALEV